MLLKQIKRLCLVIIMIGALISGIILLGDRNYYVVSTVIACCCIGLYALSFEKRELSTRRIVLLSIMVALCVAGRFLFIALPGFKPVTAIVVLTGLYFGSEAGLVTGAMAALVSNLIFGQGPWTPFQMIAWGGIGFFAGVQGLQSVLHTKIGLALYGVGSGGIYSLIMDVWSTLALDGQFVWTRFFVKVGSSLPFMGVYAVSNVVFLWAMRKPMGEKLARVKKLYHI